MKRISFLMLLFISLATLAQSKNNMEMNLKNEEMEVLSIVRQLTELMIERDTEAIDKILDKDYTLTHITNYVQPKKEWFDEVRKESMKYYAAEEVSHTVKIDGNKANVLMRNLVDARIWGSRNTWRLQQTMQLEKRDGKWIILDSVARTF